MVTQTALGTKRQPIVIIGGGQAGLAIGYFLKKAGKDFIILDENDNIGDAWRKRWDSLLLFTPAQHDSLPGIPFPASRGSFPGKDQMADYLEMYATRFSLPVHTGVKVNHIYSRGDHYEIEISDEKLLADKVVIATGTNPHPYIPSISDHIAPDIYQIHSSAYHNPESLPVGDVLVVGAATSGIEIALEISKTHTTFISGRPTFHIPDKVLKYAGEFYWWFVSTIITVNTPIGKKAKEKIIHGGSPLIRVSYDDLEVAGVETLPRLNELNNGRPQFENGSALNVSSIIWATGYRPDFSWIEMNLTDETGWPMTKRGISSTNYGLYFIGMPFQFGLTSGLVGGVGRDADYISRHILSH